MSVGVAIIGSGIFATTEHLPAVQASPHLTLKAVYSRSSKSAKELANHVPGVDVYSDDSAAGYDDLLKRSDIHAIIIALPIKNQIQYIRSGLLTGKHVLSEKPVAENLAEAKDTIAWYRAQKFEVSWCVAENWRFLESFRYASSQVVDLGRLLGFQVRSHMMHQTDFKYYNTEWRKNPTHQGGFLLDSGVHFLAGLRQLLNAANEKIGSVAAFSGQLQEHLPPVDTLNAILQTSSGISGTYQQSNGTTLRGNEWTIACEKGTVSVNREEITIRRGDAVETKTVPNERTGVPPEVRMWAEGIVEGKVLKELEPEQALADLEILEKMLRSGEQGGKVLSCELQSV